MFSTALKRDERENSLESRLPNVWHLHRLLQKGATGRDERTLLRIFGRRRRSTQDSAENRCQSPNNLPCTDTGVVGVSASQITEDSKWHGSQSMSRRNRPAG